MEQNAIHENADSSDRYLCFSLDKSKCAIPLLSVREVIGNVEATPIPQSPDYFKGVINLRGQVISVIDLRKRLNLGKESKGDETTIIILDLGQFHLGVVVDSVDCVAAYEKTQISAAPELETGLNSDFVSHVAKTENSITLVLNMRKILGVDDLSLIQRQAA